MKYNMYPSVMGNLSLWSVTSNDSSDSKIGHNEEGI